MELTKEFRFEASHILPKHPGKCSRLHGHSWVLRVSIKGEINPDTGFVMDYADITKAVGPLIERLDHRHLGQWVSNVSQQSIPTDLEFYVGRTSHMVEGLLPDFYPTSENLLIWIAGQLQELDSYMVYRAGVWTPREQVGFRDVKHDLTSKHYWSRVELDETCTSRAILTREEFDAL